jgi:hypothetical protein
MIGSLLYLTASRPDITFVVGVCVRYQAERKDESSDSSEKDSEVHQWD